MSNLDLLKELLNIETTNMLHDNVLNFNLIKAEKAIKKYTRLFDITEYNEEIIDLAMYYYNNQRNIGIKNQSEGSRSKSYDFEEIPTLIKARLPLPSIRMW